MALNLIYFYDSPGSSDPGRICHETSGVVVSGGTTAQVESAAQYLSDLDNEMSGTEVVVG